MLSGSENIIAVIPAFNEASTIARVIRSVRPYVQEIIVVDDSSSDNTYREAKNADAVVVRHEANRGYDASLERGFREAMQRGATIIVTIDADGQHNPDDIPKLTKPIAENKVDMSIGKRVGGKKHIVETIFALYTRLRFSIPDPLCGLKAYSSAVYETIGHFDSIGSTGTQLMLEAARRGFRFQVIPVTIMPRTDTSRFYAHLIRANWRIFKSFVKILLSV